MNEVGLPINDEQRRRPLANRRLCPFHLGNLLFCMVFVCVGDRVTAQDTIVLKPQAVRSGRTKYFGRVQQYDAERVVLVTASGREQSVDANRVLAVETTATKEETEAERLFQEHRYQQALRAYDAALAAEDRDWVRRKIVARKVLCLSALGDVPAAARLFIALQRVEPNHRFLHVLPQAWESRDWTPEQRSKLEAMLAGNPIERLIAASCLIPGKDRDRVKVILKKLATENDETNRARRIAALARIHQLRVSADSGVKDRLTKLQQRITDLPFSDRGGARYVLGKLLMSGKQYEEAAIEFMRLPILYSDHGDLAANGLKLASICLERAGDKNEALSVLRELADQYTATSAGQWAVKRMDQEKPIP